MLYVAIIVPLFPSLFRQQKKEKSYFLFFLQRKPDLWFKSSPNGDNQRWNCTCWKSPNTQYCTSATGWLAGRHGIDSFSVCAQRCAHRQQQVCNISRNPNNPPPPPPSWVNKVSALLPTKISISPRCCAALCTSLPASSPMSGTIFKG